MPPRTTLGDRARKSRIREREFRQMRIQLRKLDEITDEQVSALKKIKASEATGKPVKASSVAGWQALHEMGAVREQDGNLILTSTGATVVSTESK